MVSFLNNDHNVTSTVTRPIKHLIDIPKLEEIVEQEPEEIIKKDDNKIDVDVKGDEINIQEIIKQKPNIMKEVKRKINDPVKTNDSSALGVYIIVGLASALVLTVTKRGKNS